MTDADRDELAQPARTLMSALFTVYLLLVVWLVLWKLDTPHVGRVADVPVNLVPFKEGATPPREVIANVLLFVPLGVYLGLLARSWQWWKVGGAALALSLVLEALQYLLGIGIPDITDLVANTAGGLVGCGLVLVTRRLIGDRTDVVLTWICVSFTALAVVATAAFVTSPVRYHPPDDVGPLSSLTAGT